MFANCVSFDKTTNVQSNQEFCDSTQISTPCLIVHGGAGNINDAKVVEKMLGCKKSASVGYKKLMNGETSLEAVVTALWWLENDEFFNCGYGSVLNEIGDVQMDACLMDGTRFKCGSVAAVSDVEHPISLAKFVLENYPNTIITGEGAKRLAKNANMHWISKGNMVAPAAHLALKLSAEDLNVECDIDDPQYVDILRKSSGTVGCVAWDGYTMAVGTTTGGLNRKMVGRVGDSALLGCGIFANGYAGCSLTGHGETMIKLGMSRAIVMDITEGCCPREALQRNLDNVLSKTGHTSGGIALQKNGCWGFYFTSPRMPYAVITNDWITYGAELNEKRTERYYDSDVQRPCGCE